MLELMEQIKHAIVGCGFERFGGVNLFETQDGTWRATFKHRGSRMTLFADDVYALRDTLLELKKARRSMEEVIELMDERSRLRLYEIYHTSPLYRPWHQPDIDEWLLLNGLAAYEPQRENMRSHYAGMKPSLQPLSLTELGSNVCSELFFRYPDDRCHKVKRREYLETTHELVKLIYTLDEPRQWNTRPYIALHSRYKVAGVAECLGGAQSIYFDQEMYSQKIVRVYPQYKIPPEPGVCVTAPYLEYCTETVWEPKEDYERIT